MCVCVVALLSLSPSLSLSMVDVPSLSREKLATPQDRNMQELATSGSTPVPFCSFQALSSQFEDVRLILLCSFLSSLICLSHLISSFLLISLHSHPRYCFAGRGRGVGRRRLPLVHSR